MYGVFSLSVSIKYLASLFHLPQQNFLHSNIYFLIYLSEENYIQDLLQGQMPKILKRTKNSWYDFGPLLYWLATWLSAVFIKHYLLQLYHFHCSNFFLLIPTKSCILCMLFSTKVCTTQVSLPWLLFEGYIIFKFHV